MKLPKAVHTEKPYRARTLAPDFAVWDVWELPVQADEAAGQTFPYFLEFYRQAAEQLMTGPSVAGWLFRLRGWMGRVFKWDEKSNALPIPGCTEHSLRDRLTPEELATGPGIKATDFATFQRVYELPTEVFLELSNSTCHAGMHLAWVPKGNNHFVPHMAVYVKPRGFMGKLYLGLIWPFRHGIVYPVLMRQLKRRWLLAHATPTRHPPALAARPAAPGR